jgi:hypothetical protein
MRGSSCSPNYYVLDTIAQDRVRDGAAEPTKAPPHPPESGPLNPRSPSLESVCWASEAANRIPRDDSRLLSLGSYGSSSLDGDFQTLEAPAALDDVPHTHMRCSAARPFKPSSPSLERACETPSAANRSTHDDPRSLAFDLCDFASPSDSLSTSQAPAGLDDVVCAAVLLGDSNLGHYPSSVSVGLPELSIIVMATI